MPTLSIGDVIIDNYGRECLVYAEDDRPGTKWISEQEDVRVQQAIGPWWRAMPLVGGAVIVPDDLGIFSRRATIDDLTMLMESQQTHQAGTATLVDLFQRLRSVQIGA